MKFELSIIIPIYKVEEYIEECLDSVFSQLPDDVEIILINDGTPDKSVDIIKLKYSGWLAKDQIVLLEQKNAGPGAARNHGLDVARGEYIGFLDSDDVLLENYFHTILKEVYSDKFDVIEFGYKRFNKVSDIPSEKYQPLYKFTGFQEIEDVRNNVFSVGVWFPSIRICKREVFENIRFTEGVFYEDLMTIPHIYLKNIDVFFIDKPLIGYRVNPSSTTALHTEPHLQDMYQFYFSLVELENTIPINILKIRTARSIVYFYHELAVIDFPIQSVINSIKEINKKVVLFKHLKFADLLFFTLPKLYMMIDKIRLKKNKK